MTTAATTTITLYGKLPVPADLEEMASVRISDSEAREELRKLKEALRRQHPHRPIGRALSALGPDVTEDSPEGERDRRLAGLVEITLQDLDARAGRRVLGYAGVVQGVLITLIPSSAIESDLPPHDGDRTRAPRNAATELVLEAIVTLPALRLLAVPRLNRLMRRVDHQGRVLNELRDHEVLLVTDSGERDLRDQTQMLLTNMEGTTTGDANAISLKQTMLGGRIGALDPHDRGFSGRDFNYQSCPPGYGPRWQTSPDGAITPVKGSIVVVDGQAPAVKMMWEMFAAGATYRQIAEALAGLSLNTDVHDPKQGFPLRDGTGRTLADVSSNRGQGIMSRTLTEELAALHRTGVWRKERSTSAPIKEAGGQRLERRADGRRAAVIEGRLPVLMVDGLPWGVASATWDAVAARFARQKRDGPSDRGGRWSTALMKHAPMFHTPHGWFRFMKEHTTLQLRFIPAAATGEPPEWDWNQSALVAACNFRMAWQRIGAALMIALTQAGALGVPLTLVGAGESDAVRKARAALDRCRSRAAEAQAEANNAGELASAAQEAGHRFAAAEHLARQEVYLATVADADAQEPLLAAELNRALAAPPDERAEMGTALGVAAALIRWDGKDDPVLRRAVHGLGLVSALQGSYNPRSGQLTVTTAAILELADGTRTSLAVEAVLPNTSRDRVREADAPPLLVGWARGADLATLAADRGLTEGWARQVLSRWFSGHGIDTMATSLLDCPVPTTRQVVLASLAPDIMRMPTRMSDRTPITPAIVSMLSAPYVDDAGGAWKSWAGGLHANDRRMIAVLRIAGGQADVTALEIAAGADPGRLAKPFGSRPAVATAPAAGLRRLRRCPHEDCPNEWATHVLYVPETAEFGLICRTCRRLPDARYVDAPFPPEYLVSWDVDRGGERQRTVRASAAGLRLPNVGIARVAGELLRPRDAAAMLKVTGSHFGDLRRAGKLPKPVITGKVDLWLAADLAGIAQRRAAGFRWGIKDGRLSPAEAARLLGVPEHRVRAYCDEGELPYKLVGTGHNARRRINAKAVAAFTPPLGDLTRALSVQAAAKHAGLSRQTLDVAIERGDLCTVMSSTATRRVLPEALDEWLAGRAAVRSRSVPSSRGVASAADGRLSASAAGALLGLSAKQVRRLADQGHLDDHRDGGTGWRWFDRAEVERLAAQLRR